MPEFSEAVNSSNRGTLRYKYLNAVDMGSSRVVIGPSGVHRSKVALIEGYQHFNAILRSGPAVGAGAQLTVYFCQFHPEYLLGDIQPLNYKTLTFAGANVNRVAYVGASNPMTGFANASDFCFGRWLQIRLQNPSAAEPFDDVSLYLEMMG